MGKKSVALALIRHFGSLNAMARASFQELRQFLPQRKAEGFAPGRARTRNWPTVKRGELEGILVWRFFRLHFAGFRLILRLLRLSSSGLSGGAHSVHGGLPSNEFL